MKTIENNLKFIFFIPLIIKNFKVIIIENNVIIEKFSLVFFVKKYS
jgi:hypothetical protein